MNMRSLITRAALTAILFTSPAAASSQEAPRPAPTLPALPVMTVGPQIQRIATASAVSKERLGTIVGVRELRDGRVMVNDGSRRRLIIMDTTLTNVEIVLDSLSEISNTYGVRPGALLPYRGDSLMFVDPASYAIVVLDPAGRMARIRSIWRAEDITWVSSGSATYGIPGIDAKGRVIYRIPARPGAPLVAPPAGVPFMPIEPDSAFIIAVDLDTRKVDTLGAVRTPKREYRARQTPEGYMSMDIVNNPLPVQDDWAVLSDGTVAFVRALDYRIDYINPDGTRSSSQKLPYDWQRLLQDDKKRMVDSVAAAMRRSSQLNFTSSMIRWVNQTKNKYPPGFTVPTGFMLPPGLPKDAALPPGMTFPENYVYACAPGVEPVMPTLPTAPTGTTGPPAPGTPPAQPSCFPGGLDVFMGSERMPPPTMRPGFVVDADELPDFKPLLPVGAVRADMDGNLWIRTNQPKPIPGGLVYDIVDRKGELVTRYQLPPGYTIVGFGRDKVVYLSMRDAAGIHLARVRLR
jgi:hypothetical protein